MKLIKFNGLLYSLAIILFVIFFIYEIDSTSRWLLIVLMIPSIILMPRKLRKSKYKYLLYTFHTIGIISSTFLSYTLSFPANRLYIWGYNNENFHSFGSELYILAIFILILLILVVKVLCLLSASILDIDKKLVTKD